MSQGHTTGHRVGRSDFEVRMCVVAAAAIRYRQRPQAVGRVDHPTSVSIVQLNLRLA